MILTILKIWIVAFVLVFYSGWGLAHWLTPTALRPVRPLLVPFFGYAVIVIALYYLLWLGIAIDTGRWIVLLLATVLNVGGWWATRRAPPTPLCTTELGIASAVALLGGVVAVLPLLAHGILAPMGASWDVEFYLPLATYLRHLPYARLGEAPPNPLVGIIQTDPTYARAIGFSYLQALVDGVRDWDALRTFAPMLGFMRLLAAPAVFLFARYGLRLSRWTALFGAILIVLNELLLWVEYTDFAMHVSSMPLVPLTLLLTILALQELRPRTTLGATLMLAALATSYHPGLLGYGALAAGAGLWYLIQSRQRGLVVLHGMALVLGAALITLLVQVRADRAFFQVYEQGASALGTPGYISLPTLLGLTPLAAAEAPAPPPWGTWVVAAWPAVINLAFGTMLLLGVLWLLRGRGERLLGLTMGVLALVYALGLRYVVAFPYGHMKGLSFISFVPLVMVAGGLEVLASSGRLRQLRRAASAGATLLILTVVICTAWSSYSRVARAPALYGPQQLRLLELQKIVPAGATVLLGGSEELRGTTAGLAAYALRDHPLIGRTATGYLVYDQVPVGATAAYALLGPHEDPAAWGFLEPPVWHSTIADLYRGPDRRLAHLSGQTPAADYPTALHQPTALQLAEINQGAYRMLDRTLELQVGTTTLTWQPYVAAPAVSRTLLLAVGATQPSTIQVTGGGLQQTLHVPAGVTVIPTASFSAPAVVHLEADRPVVLRWSELYAGAPSLSAGTPTLFLATTTTFNDQSAAVQIVPGPTNERLRLSLEIYEDAGYPRHYGAAVFDLAQQRLAIDLAARRITVDGKPLAVQWEPRRAGRYWAALWVYQGQTLIQRLPLFRFADDGKQVSALAQLPANAAFIELPAPSLAQDGTFGTATAISGIGWSGAAPGRRAQLSMWWRSLGPTAPLLVTAQILDGADHKWAQWDGLLGGDGSPSGGWGAGQIIRQDIPLAINPQAVAGDYRLLLRVYHPDTGASVPFSSGKSGTTVGDLVVTVHINN